MDARLFPRLDRRVALERLGALRSLSVDELSRRMPLDDVPTRFSPVGGVRVTAEELAGLREAVVATATEQGFPSRDASSLGAFDTACARVLHETMLITPYEAGHEEVWTFLTLALLLDVAAWRYPNLNDERVVGTVDRNTFRRLWWRAHILNEPATEWNGLYGLGEDELVQIMERPTLWGQPMLARALALRFAREVAADPSVPRMDLMRDVARRMIRLTPFVMIDALAEDELDELVDRMLRQSVVALTGRDSTLQAPAIVKTPTDTPADGIELIDPSRDEEAQAPTVARPQAREGEVGSEDHEPERIALGLAVSLGRVTNATLREASGLDASEARRVLLDLVARNVLEQRGAKRGTHYVLRSVSSEVEALADEDDSSQAPEQTLAPAVRQPLLRSLRKAVGRRRARH